MESFPPLARQFLVLLGVLAEGGELVERRVHRPGLRVDLGVVVAGGLAPLGRVGRELVVEAIEVDPLSTLHQPLHVGPPEVEVPEQRIQELGLPGADPRERGIHHHQLLHPGRVLHDEGEGDRVPDVVGDHVDLLHLQRVEHAGDVPGLVLLVVAALGLRRIPIPRRSGMMTE